MTSTVTVADAVPPRPSSIEYVKAISAAAPSAARSSAGGVNTTAPPPSATSVAPLDGVADRR